MPSNTHQPTILGVQGKVIAVLVQSGVGCGCSCDRIATELLPQALSQIGGNISPSKITWRFVFTRPEGGYTVDELAATWEAKNERYVSGSGSSEYLRRKYDHISNPSDARIYR